MPAIDFDSKLERRLLALVLTAGIAVMAYTCDKEDYSSHKKAYINKIEFPVLMSSTRNLDGRINFVNRGFELREPECDCMGKGLLKKEDFEVVSNGRSSHLFLYRSSNPSIHHNWTSLNAGTRSKLIFWT